MKVLIAGDFCPQHRVAEMVDKGEFDIVLGEVKSIIEQADYSIVNFECPVCYGGEKPILKCGPNLSCSRKGVEAMKWVGFDCFTLANNHFLDYGKEGVFNTLETCTEYEIDTVGGGKNLHDASKTLYKEMEGKILAIINCCEHEFSIATENTSGSNPLDTIRQYYAIKEARHNADYVLVIVHGGNEYYQLPSPRMKKTYRFFIDAGADAVINHHQHCYSGLEFYKRKPIAYGLGNFCFDKKKRKQKTWYEGYMAEIEFSCNGIIMKQIPYFQCKDKPSVLLYTEQEIEVFKQEQLRLSRIIQDNSLLEKDFEKFIDNFMDNTGILFEPYTNRYLRGLYKIGLIPSFVSEKWKRRLLAHIMCESHFPKIIKYLSKDRYQ